MNSDYVRLYLLLLHRFSTFDRHLSRLHWLPTTSFYNSRSKKETESNNLSAKCIVSATAAERWVSVVNYSEHGAVSVAPDEPQAVLSVRRKRQQTRRKIATGQVTRDWQVCTTWCRRFPLPLEDTRSARRMPAVSKYRYGTRAAVESRLYDVVHLQVTNTDAANELRGPAASTKTMKDVQVLRLLMTSRHLPSREIRPVIRTAHCCLPQSDEPAHEQHYSCNIPRYLVAAPAKQIFTARRT